MTATATAVKTQLLEDFDRLSAERQRQVQEFAHSLVAKRPPGVSGRDLAEFVGMLGEEGAREMEALIEEDFETVEAEER